MRLAAARGADLGPGPARLPWPHDVVLLLGISKYPQTDNPHRAEVGIDVGLDADTG